MTIAEVLQWPFTFVWPLLFSKREKAREIARQFTEAGELRILTTEQRVGFVRLWVISTAGKRWWINIRPIHSPGLSAPVFDFKYVKYIEFEYCPEGVTTRHPSDPSSYATVKNMR